MDEVIETGLDSGAIDGANDGLNNDSGTNDGTNDGLNNDSGANGGANDSGRSYSEAELTAAIEAARQKWQQDADEAAELAKLSKAERDKKLFERDRDKLAQERAAFEREKLIAETGRQLRAKGLPETFSERLTGADAAATLANINAFETEYAKAVEAAVTERLKSKAPRLGTNTNTGADDESDAFLKGFLNN